MPAAPAPPAADDAAAGPGPLADPDRLAAVWRYSPPGLWAEPGGEESAGAGRGDGGRGATEPAAISGGAADRLVRAAGRSLGCPLALLAVVTDEDFAVVAQVGDLAGLAAGSVVPAADTICPACVAAGQTVAVPDAAAHPAHAAKPAVARFGVRAYLGCPVRPDGVNTVAVLCVADLTPRAWSPDDEAALEDLAALAASHLAARRQAADRREDAARLKKAADKLRVSERRFRDIARSAGEYLWEMDARGRFTFLTPQAEETFGRPVAELIGRRPWDLYGDPAECTRVEAWFRGVMGRREPFRNLVRRGRRPDGSETWVKVSGRPVVDAAGTFEGYRGVGLDVTAERRATDTAAELAAAADAARRERSDLLERFVRNAPVAVAMFDDQMRYLAHSRRWVEEHRLPAGANLLHRSHYEAFPGQPDRWREAHAAGLRGESRRAQGDAFVRGDGTAGWLDWQLEPWRTEGGAVGGLIISFADITDRQSSLTRLQLAVDAADIGTWLWDLRTDVLLPDAVICDLFGFAEPEARTVGVSPDRFYDAIHPDDHAAVAAAVQQAYQTGTFDCEYRVRAGGFGPGGDGRERGTAAAAVRWVAGRGRVVRDEHDVPQTFHGAILDVTDRKRGEADLRAATAAAEASDRAKSEFLANMSHELRTPLTAILGFADLIADAAGKSGAAPTEPAGDADVHRAAVAGHCGTIRRNGEHLLRLINDILDLAKIEAGKLTVSRVPVPVRPLLDELTALMRPKAEAKGLRLEVRCDAGGAAGGDPPWEPGAILGDPTRLRQILLNLAGNAVKFTAAGSVTLTVRPLAPDAHCTDGTAAGVPRLEFAVRDTGPGIGAADRVRLFEPFEQADGGPTRAAGGTGLGLSISRRLAERLGGSLSVESEEGAGSTFTLRLPAEPAPGTAAGPPAGADGLAPAEPAPEPPARPVSAESAAPAEGPLDRPLAGRRVLLAEDTEDTRRLIAFFLERSGAEVECVENGRLAVDRLAPDPAAGGPVETPADGGFDVVLMDMQMPVLDGYSATRELRARGYAGPVVALTAHAMSGDAGKCLDAGCDAYATKPLGRDELVAHVLGAVTGAGADSGAGVRGDGAEVRYEPVPY